MTVIDIHNHFVAPEVISVSSREGKHFSTRIVECAHRQFFLIKEKAIRPIDGPVSDLIARGAKSGKLRPLPLLCQEIDGKYVIVGSKGGAPTHPGWYVNLTVNPECEIRVASKRMRAGPYGERRRANARLEEDGGDVSAVR